MDLTIAGAILAGGKAMRFGGFPKGLLEIAPGVTFVQNILQEMMKAGISKLAISTNEVQAYRKFQGQILTDSFPDGGPLAGIESALAYFEGKCDGVLFMPCDLPYITSKEMKQLIQPFFRGESQVIVAQTGDLFWHPLCVVVHIDLLPLVREALKKNCFKISPVWQKVNPRPVWFEDCRPFVNVNSPKEYDDIRDSISKSESNVLDNNVKFCRIK